MRRSPALLALLVLAGCNRVFGVIELADAAKPGEAGEADDDAIVVARFCDGLQPHCLCDDFEDNTIDLTQWEITDLDNSPISVNARQEQLVISLVPSPTGPYIWNALQTVTPRDMTDGLVVVEVVQAVNFIAGTENYLILAQDIENSYAMSVGAQGSFTFDVTAAGIRNRTGTTFDPVLHRHWRIRHEALAGMIHLETSADRVEWASQKVTQAAVPVTSLRVLLGAGAFEGGNPDPGAAIYDDIQLVTAGCPLR